MHAYTCTHTQEHSPRHGDDGDEVSLAVVGNKPDAREAFQLSKCLQDDPAAGLVWGGDTIAECPAKSPEPSCPLEICMWGGN